MSIFEKMKAATDTGDVDAYVDLMTDDFEFIRHQNGTKMNKAETAAMLQKMMSSGGRFGERRCIYENDDIMVVHSINDYPDGTREAVLAAYSLQNGKIRKLETGATRLS